MHAISVFSSARWLSISAFGFVKWIPFSPFVAQMAKRIVVTGGNAGIGFALCRQLAVEHGWQVLIYLAII